MTLVFSGEKVAWSGNRKNGLAKALTFILPPFSYGILHAINVDFLKTLKQVKTSEKHPSYNGD
jgi:hypothetical protein